MLAALHNKIKFTPLVLIILSLLSACSRDNPLSVPPAYIEEESYCFEGSPYTPRLLESILTDDFTANVPANYPDGYINTPLAIDSQYLVDNVIIKPIQVSDTALLLLNEANQIDSSDGVLKEYPVIVRKQVSVELLLRLAGSGAPASVNDGQDPFTLQELVDGGLDSNLITPEIIKFFDFQPLVNSLSILVESDNVNDVIDEETPFLSLNLNIGQNVFRTKVTANLTVPRTFIDCDNPLTEEELSDEDFEEADLYKNVKIEQEFLLTINRNSINQFLAGDLDEFITLSENDNFGKILAISDDFLAVGLPDEDTLANEIYDVDDFRGSLGFELDNRAINSGAVVIYKKNEQSVWEFHQFIKSSNSEAGDRFGSAISLVDNTLAVSASGEDSIGAGIFITSDNETASQKLNNSAQSSGAVYLYKYNETTDSWSETHYIKPNRNVVSGGNYNKGFGSVIALTNSDLFITAPFEDSSDGQENSSVQPNSGAVYLYRYSQDDSIVSFEQVIKAINAGAGDNFGASLSFSASSNLIAIGAPFEDSSVRQIVNNIAVQSNETIDQFNENNRINSGAVYVYSYVAGLLTLEAIVKSTNGDESDFFGASVALEGNKLLVSSTGEDSSGKGLNRDMNKNDLSNSGAVYLFSLDGPSNLWTETAYIKANDSQSESAFGKYLDVYKTNVVISSPLYDTETKTNAGKVYIYRLEGDSLVQDIQFQDTGSESEARFGSSLTLNKDSLAIGSSGFVDQTSGNDEVFTGNLQVYQ